MQILWYPCWATTKWIALFIMYFLINILVQIFLAKKLYVFKIFPEILQMPEILASECEIY